MLPAKSQSRYAEEGQISCFKDGSRLQVISKQFASGHLMQRAAALHQHLYFLSNEKIEAGEWFMKWSGGKWLILKASQFNIKQMNELWNDVIYYKIIATTDELVLPSTPLLKHPYNIKSSVPKVTKVFIEEYCELGGINEVDVRYVCHEGLFPTKKECRLSINAYNEIDICLIKNKWTREEIEAKCKDAWRDGYEIGQNTVAGPIMEDNYEQEDIWIKENL